LEIIGFNFDRFEEVKRKLGSSVKADLFNAIFFGKTEIESSKGPIIGNVEEYKGYNFS
jgi:hypothetical protein